MGDNLTATDGVHNLDAIAGIEQVRFKLAAGNDFLVDLHGQPFVCQTKLLDQLRGTEFIREFPGFAVNHHFHTRILP